MHILSPNIDLTTNHWLVLQIWGLPIALNEYNRILEINVEHPQTPADMISLQTDHLIIKALLIPKHGQLSFDFAGYYPVNSHYSIVSTKVNEKLQLDGCLRQLALKGKMLRTAKNC